MTRRRTPSAEAAAVSPDARLIALSLAAVQNHAESDVAMNALDEMERYSPAANAAWEVIRASSARWNALCDDIAATPASTLEGMKAKAAVLADVIALEEPLVASLCLDLLGRDRPGIDELLEAENPSLASHRADVEENAA